MFKWFKTRRPIQRRPIGFCLVARGLDPGLGITRNGSTELKNVEYYGSVKLKYVITEIVNIK